MSEPELKDNLCKLSFECDEKNKGDCVHHANNGECKYYNSFCYTCSNTIAQVQAISNYLKSIGLELSTQKPISKETSEKAKAEFLKTTTGMLCNSFEQIKLLEFVFAEFCESIGI